MAENRTVVVTAAKRVDAGTERVRLNAAYVTALENAGLVPLVVPPLGNASAARQIISRVGGLVLSGGGDLDPVHYGEPLHPKAHPPQVDRDATELALIAAARERRLPVLAICRGIQVLNVALGGTLVQDIGSQVPSALQHDAAPESGAAATRDSRTHDVIITPGSRLARALGSTHIAVNSFHHQAVARTADELRETAHSPDGIIEGLETDGDWWVLAVQWHPEEMDRTEQEWDRSLFAAFAEAVTHTGS